MHQALYRKWRSPNFDEVYGQEHITSVLKYEAANGKLSHAYLFCGSRGTGKTSCAKILAKVVNCESPVNGNPCGKCENCRLIESGAATDILEMDAASYTSVDSIRDIRDEVVYTPSVLKYRVYIIDEVHMLSGSAFNALLKTLEEPPEHVIFILATTELQKLPATIISRCQRFDFRRIAAPVIQKRLLQIAAAEGIDTDKNAALLIAKYAQGGMRDAISLLELCAGSNGRVTEDTVNEAIGGTGRAETEKTVRAVASGDYDAVFSAVNNVVNSSRDITVFWQDIITLYRDMLIAKTSDNAAKYLDLTETENETLKSLSAMFTKAKLLYHCRLLDDALYAMQRANAVKRVEAEMTLLKMCDETLDSSNEALLARIIKLEDIINGAEFKPRSEKPVANVPAAQKSDTAPEQTQPKNSENKKEQPPKADALKASAASQETGNHDSISNALNDKPQGKAEPTLKGFRRFAEVVEKVLAVNKYAGAIIKCAKAATDGDGNFIVFVESDMHKEVCGKPATKELIRASVSAVMKTELAPEKLVFRVINTDSEKTDIFDFLGE